MKGLFDNKLAPITSDIGFIEGELDGIFNFFLKWILSLGKGRSKKIEAPLERSLRCLEPLRTPPDRLLFVETKSQWVAYFDNGKDGPDPESTIGSLTSSLRRRGLRIACVPNTLTTAYDHHKGTYGAVIFSLFAAEKREWLNYERTIHAVNDGGSWSFGLGGTPQPFEQPERYKANKIKDRFTDQMLEDYCRALGIDVFNPDFYGPKARLFITEDERAKKFPSYTLEERRKDLGLE